MYKSRGQRRSATMLTMAPSSIHHINSDSVDIISPELDKTIIEVSKNALKAGEHLKIQAVQNEGLWFALNSAQLDLCRRLEEEGSCQVVLVDPVPAAEVPEDVRRMMKVPVNRGRDRKYASAPAQTVNNEQKGDNVNTADVSAGGQGGPLIGGKGYRMLDQADPLDLKDRQTSRIVTQKPSERDDDVIHKQSIDMELERRVEATDESSDEDSSDSECDWSDDADDSGSEEDHARMADTSDEMSCLL